MESKPDPVELAADFLSEYPRRFIFLALDAAADAESGKAWTGVDLEDLLQPWNDWCVAHGKSLDRLMEPLTDADAGDIYDEISCFLVFLLLRAAGRRKLPPETAQAILASVPASTPFGELSPKERIPAYNRAENPVATFTERIMERLDASETEELRERMIVIGAVMGKVTDGVAAAMEEQ